MNSYNYRVLITCLLFISLFQEVAARRPYNLASDTLLLFVGSYASPQEEGISLYKFNQRNGEAIRIAGLSGISNPSYLTINSQQTMIYSVGEDSEKGSTINAIGFDTQNLRLSLLKSVPSQGAAPCHINLSPSGKQVVAANYGGGSATAYQLDANLLPTGSPTFINFNTDCANETKKAHAHFVTFTPDNREIWVTNLGLDRIHRFPLNNNKIIFDRKRMNDIILPTGSGPRHIDFLPRLKRAYIIDELDGYVNVIDYSSSNPKIIQRILADSLGAHGSGDIHIAPSGRFLYASNRIKGDGIAIFAINQQSGLLRHIGYQPTGPHPRNFVITPNGRLMLVACRDSNEIEIYSISLRSGFLSPLSTRIRTPRPVCLRFSLKF